MQVRWVIAGMLAIVGAYWLAAGTLFKLGLDVEWVPYAAFAIAALSGGALIVALAPLRPWREPAAAGVLAVAGMAALALARREMAFNWVLRHALQPWYVGVSVAAVSGALAAAGGLAARRIVPATTRTDLIVALSALVTIGITASIILATMGTMTPLVLLGGVGGGFVTQAAIAPRRPWVCGAGGAAIVLLSMARYGSLDATTVAGLIFGGLYLLLGTLGARLAWRLLLRGGEPPPPDVPPARLS